MAKAGKQKRDKDEPGDDGPILVAVDFSDDSHAALSWACRLATAMKARVIVLHVVHDPANAPGYYKRDEKDLVLPMEDILNQSNLERERTMLRGVILRLTVCTFTQSQVRYLILLMVRLI